MEGYQKDGASFVKLHKFTDHFRTSAKTGEGIEEAVRAAVKEVRYDIAIAQYMAQPSFDIDTMKETYPHPPEICA